MGAIDQGAGQLKKGLELPATAVVALPALGKVKTSLDMPHSGSKVGLLGSGTCMGHRKSIFESRDTTSVFPQLGL